MSFSVTLRALINRAIDSVEHVEVLLLLKRDPEHSWTPAHVAEELRRSSSSVERRLRDLVRARLVSETNGTYAYDPGSHAKAVDELEYEYEHRRVRLIEAIFSRSIDSARSFADAFRLWGEDDDR
ncbi:MAG TPA: hypothetical protein VFN49_03815 [Candidatus Aquilonibacter sp.]|nr:hypothetical protein [Candidatus Aquilonibacter sp.]